MKKSVAETIQTDHPEFAEQVAGLSIEQLNHRLADLAKNREAVISARDADEQLALAKEQAKEYGAPYRDGIKAIGLKSSYIVALIKEKGGE